MNYITTKLSEEDKHILDKIYRHLEDIKLPSRFQKVGAQGHSKRTGACTQKGARQTCFGYTTYKGRKQLSVNTKKHPCIMDLFRM